MRKSKTKLLVTRDHPVLRQAASEVPLEDIGSKKINGIISKMKQALHAEDDGVAIAAPQIGYGLKIFIVRDSVIPQMENEPSPEDMIFINPKLVKVSKKTSKMEEGCLSLRYLYGEVFRYEKVTIEAYDENGHYLSAGASGLLAQIFQHEMDHLEGILFTDKAENVRDLPPDHQKDA